MKIALFTNKENEDPLWPVWWKYYSDHVDHIETINLRAINPTYPPGTFAKEAALRQRKLLESFDVVLYTDIDEFLIPDPHTYKGLRDYIEQHWNELPKARGYHLVHNGEPEINLVKPLLFQRSWWARDKLYSKRLITHAPVTWAPGFHITNGLTAPEDGDNLILLHILYMDDKLAHERLKASYPNRSITQVREKIESFELSEIPERFRVV